MKGGPTRTREEAANKSCEERIKHLESAPPHHYGKRQRERAIELEKVKIKALRPVSRERVERMRGEWMFPIFGDQQDANDPRCQCSKCGSIETPLARHRFCPSCGAPMTDEAVEMVMERWKEAANENP